MALGEEEKTKMLDEIFQSLHALATGKATLQFIRSSTAGGNAASTGQSAVTGVRIVRD